MSFYTILQCIFFSLALLFIALIVQSVFFTEYSSIGAGVGNGFGWDAQYSATTGHKNVMFGLEE